MLREQDLLAEIPRLRRYARALTGDAARADDLVQDTLERALSKWTLWRPGNLGAWLRTLMHNLFINQLRDRPPSERNLEALEGPAFEVPTRPRQQDLLELRDVDRALQRLAPEQREVLLLVGLEDMSYSEAARVTGVPVGTVMSRLSRGRERLRQILAEGLDGSEAPPLRRIK
jgi:RNA polymerase sigma-70 factor (ECF subfamily)